MGVRALAWVPAGEPPGQLGEVELEPLAMEASAVVFADLRVEDVRPCALSRGDLRVEPDAGGGPLSSEEEQRAARAFGVLNAAYHLRRGLDYLQHLLGHDLPPLVVRIGCHADRRWGGGHYRLPASSYSELPEAIPPATTGEIHLGPGNRYVVHHGRRYFHAPAHNPSIVAHELGHHLCRHTADFRLNALRPPDKQTNRKTPVEEGTADYLAATLVAHPDIFAWHRAEISADAPPRRRVDNPWTMAEFRGGSDADPHSDGSVWAGALWAGRQRVMAAGAGVEVFDGVLVRGLRRLGRDRPDRRDGPARRRRRYFGSVLASLLEEAEASDPDVAGPVADAFAARGILPGRSNAELRDAARQAARSR